MTNGPRRDLEVVAIAIWLCGCNLQAMVRLYARLEEPEAVVELHRERSGAAMQVRAGGVNDGIV